MELTLKQKKFCDYYMASGNATESAIKAGYSKKTAKQIGMENLTKPYLQEYLKEHSHKIILPFEIYNVFPSFLNLQLHRIDFLHHLCILPSCVSLICINL